jgi:carboxyl-terminal processing protease
MLATLDDPATLFMDPVHGAMADADLRGTFDGIGVQVDERDGKLVIIAPLEGSPGERAGLKPGDVIIAADGTDLAGMDLTQAVALIRGPRGTSVTLSIVREGTTEPLTFSIQRDEIRVESVRSRMLEDGVGYLRITTFGSETGSETQRALTSLLEQQPRGIVLDLRSNPGGYVTAAVEVVSQFVPDGVVLHQQSARGERETIRTNGGGIATEIPVVVLVDGGSASASEIVAAALRDNGRSTLVGEKTFGKGTVQTVHELGDRSSLRVTMAQWLTPNGQPLHGQGLVPDLVVGIPEDVAEGQDPQLEAAVARLLGGA